METRYKLQQPNCMTFSKGTQKEKHNFTINHQIIENIKVFKYLGITINSKNCSFSPTLDDRSCKGSRSMYAIASKIAIKGISIKKLFDTCISPILLYGGEVWGPYLNINYTNWESTPIEKLHTRIYQRTTRGKQIHHKHPNQSRNR